MNDVELLALVACPKCRGILVQVAHPAGLVCEACKLFYPIDEGLPHLLIDEAKRWPLSESPSSQS